MGGGNKQLKGFLCSHSCHGAEFALKQVRRGEGLRANPGDGGGSQMEDTVGGRRRGGKRT